MKQLNPHILFYNENIYTLNGNPGERVYGEKLIQQKGKEYRYWNPERSKPAAAMKNDFNLEIDEDSVILYLGAASGTTVSHFSDIAREGFIYGVEYSSSVARELVNLAEKRDNIAPIIGDARNVEEYKDLIDSVDILYQDVSQKDQAEILVKNGREFLESGDLCYVAVKARSISSTKEPEKVFNDFKSDIVDEFDVIQEKRLEPYEKDHLFLKLARS